MSELVPLPFQGAIYANEGFMGFVLRMSNLNGLLGVHWLYSLLGRDKLNHFKSEDGFAIAKLFGAEMTALNLAMVRPRRIAI